MQRLLPPALAVGVWLTACAAALPTAQAGEATPLLAELARLQGQQGGTVMLRQQDLFDADRATLKAEAMPALQQLAAVLGQHPERPVVIDGYAESGAHADDTALARQRAGTLVRALSAAGAGPQIQLRAVGASDAAGNAPRRVEILLSDDSGLVSVSQ